ncbi:hypothetical protein GCM10010452_62710 [Crossiella cryophila]
MPPVTQTQPTPTPADVTWVTWTLRSNRNQAHAEAQNIADRNPSRPEIPSLR